MPKPELKFRDNAHYYYDDDINYDSDPEPEALSITQVVENVVRGRPSWAARKNGVTEDQGDQIENATRLLAGLITTLYEKDALSETEVLFLLGQNPQDIVR